MPLREGRGSRWLLHRLANALAMLQEPHLSMSSRPQRRDPDFPAPVGSARLDPGQPLRGFRDDTTRLHTIPAAPLDPDPLCMSSRPQRRDPDFPTAVGSARLDPG